MGHVGCHSTRIDEKRTNPMTLGGRAPFTCSPSPGSRSLMHNTTKNTIEKNNVSHHLHHDATCCRLASTLHVPSDIVPILTSCPDTAVRTNTLINRSPF